MSLAFAPSATALPLVDVPAWNDRVVRRSRTELSPFLMRPEIIGVLRRWDDVPPISEADLHEFPEDSVEAVAFIASKLGVTQDEVLNATGIKERTYFGWRSSGHRPRPPVKDNSGPWSRWWDVSPTFIRTFKRGSKAAKPRETLLRLETRIL